MGRCVLMKVVLVRKLARCIDGVDLSSRHIGEVFDLPPTEARLLLAEKWAIPDRRTGSGVPPSAERRGSATPPPSDSTDPHLLRAS